jgi:hypothetical protein
MLYGATTKETFILNLHLGSRRKLFKVFDIQAENEPQKNLSIDFYSSAIVKIIFCVRNTDVSEAG